MWLKLIDLLNHLLDKANYQVIPPNHKLIDWVIYELKHWSYNWAAMGCITWLDNQFAPQQWLRLTKGGWGVYPKTGWFRMVQSHQARDAAIL